MIALILFMLTTAMIFTFYIGVIFIGFFFGGLNVVHPVIINDFFPDHVPTIYGTTLVFISISTLVSNKLFVFVYDSHAYTDIKTGEQVCFGSTCIGLSYSLWGAAL